MDGTVTVVKEAPGGVCRREYQRVLCSVPAQVQDQLDARRPRALTGTVRDISAGGLGVLVSVDPFPAEMPECVARIEIKKRGFGPPIRLVGNVVRAEVYGDNSCSIGIRFERPYYDVLASLKDHRSAVITLETKG